MDHYNGSSFEMGRLWGQLQGHMHHHGQALERQNEILLDIKDSLNDLPTRLAGMMTSTQASAISNARILPEMSELLRALYPILILGVATFGKAAWPTALPLVRAVLEAAMQLSGTG